jgi:hypothetical protein
LTAQEFVKGVIDADLSSNRQAVFDYVVEATDELFTAGQFNITNEAFRIFITINLSSAAICALLRFTYCAKDQLPDRLPFIEHPETLACITRSRGSNAAAFLESMK